MACGQYEERLEGNFYKTIVVWKKQFTYHFFKIIFNIDRNEIP